MSKIYTLAVLLLLSFAASAQNTSGTLKGKLVDSVNKQSLKDASITVLDARDSSIEVFALAKTDGTFSILNVPFGAMIIQIKFNGYETFTKNVVFSATNSNVNLGNVILNPAANELAGVTVSQSVMRVKGDTTEFNASSFKTKPNAVAEDLIKKMPGMEVGKDGSIKSNGEAVARVLVDGKRFMGDDPKLATRNLPPDVIDKIQVFDDLSDQAKFSGFDDGNRVKTLNITTRKDRKKGYFGKGVVSGGTDGRYDENLNFTRMNGDQQITLIGQANNLNRQNFSIRNIQGGRGGGFGGGGGGGAGGGSGITTVLAGGINYKDVWSPKIEAYGSYNYDQPRVDVTSASNSRKILGTDTANFTIGQSVSRNKSENHRFSFNFENKIDSMNSLVFRPNVTLQSNNSVSSSSSNIFGGPNTENGWQNGHPISTSTTNQSSYNSGYNINGSNLTLRHRFQKRGRTMSLDFNFSGASNNGDGNTYTVNTFTNPAPGQGNKILNQHFVDSSKSYTLNPTLSYTEPLSQHSMIELRYSMNYNHSESQTTTHNYDSTTGKFSTFDSLYSNAYKYTSYSNTANINYRFQEQKYNFSFGTGLQFMNIESINSTKGVTVNRNFVNFTPQANLTYNFTKSKSLRVFYNGRTGNPSTSQLQPITTSTNSINFQRGNADLKPQFTNSLRLLYNSIDPFTQKVMFATVNGNITTNDIVSLVTQIPRTGGDTTTYVNFGTTYNLNGTFMYGFPMKNPKSNWNLTTNISYGRNQSLIKDSSLAPQKINRTVNYNISETVKWTTNLKNNFDMNLSTTLAYNPIRNSLSNGTNTNYITHSLQADFTAYTNNGWTIASDFDYTRYYNRPAGITPSIFLITPSIAKTFLKNKAGELRLTCFDLLKQNQSVSVSTNANVITNSVTNNLTRYFLLTFTYNLRSFGQGQRGQQGNQMRGMFPQGGQGMQGGMMMGGFGGGGGRRGGN